MTEIELKFLIDESGARKLRSRIKALPGLEGAPVNRTLRSVYYDTPDEALRRAGIALRMRRDGRSWVQTVKAKAVSHGGLQTAREAEAPAPGGTLNLNLIPDADLRQTVANLTEGAELHPVSETAIKRHLATVRINGTARAELAVDQGEIIAGEARGTLHELEIELKEGSVGALFDLAHTLLPEGGVTFSRMSKAARGYLLSREGHIDPPAAPRKARTVPLSPEQSSETAARDVLRECFDQIATNIEVIRSIDHDEGPHQLRVGLRRLRSAFSVFKPVIGNDEMARLNAEARWLGQEVGVQRDLDVAIVDLLEPEAAAHPGETGFPVLADILRQRGDANRTVLRRTLVGKRLHAFLFDLARFIEARGWLVASDFDQTARLARPVRALAGDAIGKRWKSARRHARDIETLDVEARHELRKELKKLRYAIEFFAPVLPQKRVAEFVSRLKSLQQVFGDLNDAAMAEALFTGADAPGATDPDAQRAVGWLLGTRIERAEHHWTEARALWSDLENTKPCW